MEWLYRHTQIKLGVFSVYAVACRSFRDCVFLYYG